MNRTVLALAIIAITAGCSPSPTKSPDVVAATRTSLDQAGFKDVSISQDRDKGIVTLSGHVTAEADKAQAETVAKGLAGGQVVANEIAVLPFGGEKDAKTIAADLDKGIEKNLEAALIQSKLLDGVKFSVTAAVVTLTGSVDSQAKRGEVAKVATDVPNVKQVVNNLQVQNQKATSNGRGGN